MNQNKKTKVLFVCMGNICRSPTADAVFRHFVQDANVQHLIEVDSAGTHAYHIGHPPDHRSQQAALQRGYKMDDLRARAVNMNDFEAFDYILAMDKENLALLRQRSPKQHMEKFNYSCAMEKMLVSRPKFPILITVVIRVLNWFWIWLKKQVAAC